MTFPATQISISINRSPTDVYAFTSKPENLPMWAAGLSNNVIIKVGDLWETDSPMGKVKINFAPPNEFGVMDHDVILPNGEVNHNPFRVFKNDKGSEILFTIYRLPRMTDLEYHRDVQMVESDLKKLKAILEELQ
jgi:hypothetical protein